MKSKIKSIASLVFIGCAIALVMVTSYIDLNEKSLPTHLASAGSIDLSLIQDFKQPIKLDGEWEFYDNQLINDVQAINEANKMIVTVPDQWNEYATTRKDPRSFGYGTFHLGIKLSEAQIKQIYGFKIQNIGMSNKVILNGQVISMSGKPGVDHQSYELGNVPNYVFYAPKTTDIDMLVQVANFDYRPYSGIVTSIQFGPQAVIEKAKLTAYGYELFFLGASFVVGLIFFVLYLFRSKEKYLLFFSLYSLTSALFILTHGEKIWFHFFPEFDYLAFAKLQFFSAALNISFFIGYTYYSFPEVFKNKTTQYIGIISLVFYPAMLFPLAVQSSVSSVQIVFYVAVMLYSVYGCFNGILNKHSYALYFVLIIFSTLFMVREAIYMVLGKGEVAIWMVLAQLIWILVHSFLIAARLSNTYDLVETQAKKLESYMLELEQKVKERTIHLEEANQKLEQLSQIDGLTKIYNRRYFDTELEKIWREYARLNHPISIILIDIDYFKKYNDHYGHQEGDSCLYSVASTLQVQLNRSREMIARFGGEEFVVITCVDRDNAIKIAEKMRLAVKTLHIEHQMSEKNIVTISLGVASVIPSQGKEITALIKAADIALYESKQKGRDIVSVKDYADRR